MGSKQPFKGEFFKHLGAGTMLKASKIILKPPDSTLPSEMLAAKLAIRRSTFRLKLCLHGPTEEDVGGLVIVFLHLQCCWLAPTTG